MGRVYLNDESLDSMDEVFKGNMAFDSLEDSEIELSLEESSAIDEDDLPLVKSVKSQSPAEVAKAFMAWRSQQ